MYSASCSPALAILGQELRIRRACPRCHRTASRGHRCQVRFDAGALWIRYQKASPGSFRVMPIRPREKGKSREAVLPLVPRARRQKTLSAFSVRAWRRNRGSLPGHAVHGNRYRQVGIASPKLGMGHRLTHRDAAGGIVLAQRAVGPVGDEEALAIGMEEEAP